MITLIINTSKYSCYSPFFLLSLINIAVQQVIEMEAIIIICSNFIMKKRMLSIIILYVYDKYAST